VQKGIILVPVKCVKVTKITPGATIGNTSQLIQKPAQRGQFGGCKGHIFLAVGGGK
jgi:hypothetical protein